MTHAVTTSKRAWSRFATLPVAAVAAIGLSAGVAVAQDAEPLTTDWGEYVLGQAPEDISRLIQSDAFRMDTVTFTVGPFEVDRGLVEYKVTMDPGQTLIWKFSSSQDVYIEFHGHDEVEEGEDEEAILYHAGTLSEAAGVLVAPLHGVHGFFIYVEGLQEQAEITLHLAGEYLLEPGLE